LSASGFVARHANISSPLMLDSVLVLRRLKSSTCATETPNIKRVSVSQSVALMSSTEVRLVRQSRVALANNMEARGFCRLEMIGTKPHRNSTISLIIDRISQHLPHHSTWRLCEVEWPFASNVGKQH
jgi:hypothetical protein